MIQWLLDRGADPNAKNSVSVLPLHIACKCQMSGQSGTRIRIIDILLERSPSTLNAKDDRGRLDQSILSVPK